MEAETKMSLTKKETAEYAFDLQVGLNGLLCFGLFSLSLTRVLGCGLAVA